MVQAQATTQTHTLRAEFPHSLVSGTWDPDRVQQVLENLLSNAIKYSPEGGEIVVKVTSLENEVQVSITDQGTGIAEDVLPNLFRRFYRIRTPKTLRMPGLGLGLYITKSLVEAHGGEIRAESTAGVGSTFTFTLPTG